MNGPTFAQTATAPAAAPRPAPPRPATPAKAGPKPDADGGGLRVLTYLRLHWLMILFCGTLLGAAGSYAAWELLASKYESYALLQVSSVPSSLGNPNNPSQARTDFVTYVKTNSALIKSEFVLNAALRDMKDVAVIREQKEPIKYLDEEVMVSWQDGSEVIRITYKGHNPNDVKKVVDAVQAAYLKEVVQKDRAILQKFKDAVDTERIDMQKVLDGKRPSKAVGPVLPAAGVLPGAPVAPAAGGAPAPLPLIGGPVAGIPGMPPAPPGTTGRDTLIKLDPKFLTTQLGSLYARMDELPLQIAEAKKDVMRCEAKLKMLQGAPVDPQVVAMVDKDPDVAAARMRAMRARSQYVVAAGNSNDLTVKAIVEMREFADAEDAAAEKVRQAKIAQIDGNRKVAEANKIAPELEAALKRVNQYESQFAAVKEQLAKAEEQLLKLPAPGEKGFGLFQAGGREPSIYDPANTDLMSVDRIFAHLVQQYYMTDMELKSPPRVRPLQTASTPTQKDTKKQILGTVFAGLLGYALIALGVVAFETLTRRVSSLADLKSAGPAPVVGIIPCLPEEATGRDPAKRAAANEAIDKLRSYVAQSWLTRGATTIAVTSPLGDEGKAFTAFGLASSLAQAGYKTLLVDFDLRDPALHAYAGVPNLNGVCEILRNETDPASAVQFLPSGLHLIPAGKWSDEARKAAVGGRLESLLARIRDPYDCVVLHGHALLTVAESVEVARRCEVVLVCARYRETKVPMLRKASDRLAAMEVPYSGVVYVGATENEALC